MGKYTNISSNFKENDTPSSIVDSNSTKAQNINPPQSHSTDSTPKSYYDIMTSPESTISQAKIDFNKMYYVNQPVSVVLKNIPGSQPRQIKNCIVSEIISPTIMYVMDMRSHLDVNNNHMIYCVSDKDDIIPQ